MHCSLWWMNIDIPFSPSQMCPSPKVSNFNFHASAAESAGLASRHHKLCRVNIEATSRKWGNQGGCWPSFSSHLCFFLLVFSFYPSKPSFCSSLPAAHRHKVPWREKSKTWGTGWDYRWGWWKSFDVISPPKSFMLHAQLVPLLAIVPKHLLVASAVSLAILLVHSSPDSRLPLPPWLSFPVVFPMWRWRGVCVCLCVCVRTRMHACADICNLLWNTTKNWDRSIGWREG